MKRIMLLIGFMGWILSVAACGGGGGSSNPCDAYALSVSGQRIGISNLGECGSQSTETFGVASFSGEVTCNGERHQFSVSNITYADGAITSFNAVIDGKSCSYGSGGGNVAVSGEAEENPDGGGADVPSEIKPLSFDCVLTDYEDGFGVKDVDTITITEITGPPDATVESPKSGEYTVEGSYQLTTSHRARIGLGFSGEAKVKDIQEQEIAAGEGTFEVKSTLVEILDGTGRLGLDMTGDDGSDTFSNWMFSALPALGSSCP